MITMMNAGMRYVRSAVNTADRTIAVIAMSRRKTMKTRNNGLVLLVAEVTPQFKRNFDKYVSKIQKKNEEQKAITKRFIISQAIEFYMKRNPV